MTKFLKREKDNLLEREQIIKLKNLFFRAKKVIMNFVMQTNLRALRMT